MRITKSLFTRPAGQAPPLVDDEVIHHLAAEGARVVDPRPAGSQPLQRLLVQVFRFGPVGREQRGYPDEGVAGLAHEGLERAGLSLVHSLAPFYWRHQLRRPGSRSG